MSAADYELARRDMVRRQLQARGIRDRRVLEAMGRVPRERFVPAAIRHDAYADRAMAIECGQTISQPLIVAMMTEALELAGSEKVLEIGTGSGYQAAVLAELAAEVISVERHPGLADRAARVLEELGYANVATVVADGTLGYPERAPYDRIIVTAASRQAPQALLDQLVDGGILVIPLGTRDYQSLEAIRLVGGRVRSTTLSPCRFVPLVGEQGWPD